MPALLRAATPHQLVLLSLLCLTASGSAGLIAEVVWSRILATLFGSALPATGLLLAIFMGGLGIGSAIGGRVARGRVPPLAAFGLVELGVGTLVLATPALFRIAAPITIRLESFFPEPLVLLAPALASVVILGPIVVLMGMTFPLFLAGISEEQAELGADSGWVYGINTFGAVVGTLLAGFWLIPTFGIRTSLLAAGSIDLVVGAICLAIGLGTARPASNTRAPRTGAPWHPRIRRAFFIAALGGAAALVLEVAWFRALMSIFGSSVYAISLMLATFLLGLSGGAIFGSRRVDRSSDLPATLSRLHAQIAFTATLATFLLQIVPLGYILLLERFGGSFLLVSFGTSLLLFTTMVIPTSLMGVALPAAIAYGASGGSEEDRVRAAGRIYAGSSVGSAVGALAAGFILIPWWGVRGAVATAVVVSIAAAFAALRDSRVFPSVRTSRRIVGVTVIVWIAWMVGLLPWDWRILTGGHYAYAHLYTTQRTPHTGPTSRDSTLEEPFPFVEESFRAPLPTRDPTLSTEPRLLSWRDGKYAQVAVTEEGGIRTLLLNGKADASTGPADMRTQLLLGHLPVLFAPDEPGGAAMVIGLGSGVTAGAVASWPFDPIVVAEIEPEVVRATEWFRDHNGNVMADPRIALRTDDGRRILARTDRPFALLTSEPSNLWMSGVSLLFTREFFELAANRLGERGVFCQWLHLYQIGEEDVRTFLATISSVFPHIIVFADEADMLVVASREPLMLDPRVWQRRMRENPVAQRALGAADVRSAADLAGGILADQRGVRRWTGAATLHTDDRPILEFSAARNMSFDRSRQILSSLVVAAEEAGPLSLGTEGAIGGRAVETDALR
jgi:spermidine synthase